MFGFEHLGHLAEVAPEVLLVGCAGERDGDDPLRDIHQVQLTAVLHGPVHTHVPGETGREGLLDQNPAPPQGKVPIIYTPAHCTWPLYPIRGAWLLPDPEPRPSGKASAAVRDSRNRAGQELARISGHIKIKQ